MHLQVFSWWRDARSESELEPSTALSELFPDLGEALDGAVELVEVGSDHHRKHHLVEFPVTIVIARATETRDCS